MTSGWPNFAFSPAMRMSHAIAISHPPPSANPFTAAITGTRIRSIAVVSACPRRACASPARAFGNALSSEMSAPAANAFAPAPVTMTARSSSSASSSANVALSSSSI